MDNTEFDINQFDYISDNRHEHQEEYSFNLRVKLDVKILNEACEYFPKADNNKYPRAIQLLFGGKRRFTVYFSNASSGSFENSINFILATDVDNKENSQVLNDLENMTLSFYGFHTNNWFTITKILKVPRLAGSINNRAMKANVVFFYNHDISAYGLPEHLYRSIILLPNHLNETKVINNRISHWDEYLKINEKIAQETQVLLEYSGYRQSDNIMQLVFKIQNGIVSAKHNNSSIQLVLGEEIEDNQVSYKGPIIGTINRFNTNTKELVVDLDFDYREIWMNGKTEIPASSQLFVTKLGDIVQIRRLRNGLKTFARGQAVNPFLDVFMFDSTKARDLISPIKKLSKDQLLQSNLNSEQIIAVEGVINSQDLFLVQGPPGTGKTTVIAEICYQNAIRNQKTLIASQTNLAVDNALSKLVHHPKIRALRKGNEQSVQEEGVLFTENNVIETWLNKTATECRKLITSKEVEVQAAEAAEKELASIVNQYNKYIASTENCKSNIVKKENIEEVIKKLKSQIAWLEENYSDFINEIKGNAYDSIIINPYALGDEFINTVKCIHSTTIEQEQTRLKHESNINVINKEISMLQSSIDAISSIFNKANKNKKYIVTDEKMLSGKALSFLEWQAEAKLLEDEINLVKQKKPFSILIYIGLARKWMFSVCSLLNHYNEFKVCTELTVLDENMNLKKLLLDDKVDIMLNDLKKLFETTDIEWKENVNELIKDIRDIEIEIFKDTQNISDSQEVIDNFNKCLPYDVKAENVEQVSHMVDIQQYYLSLWKQQKASDLKYIRFITDWVQRIERKSEEDYKTFKQLYIDNANVIGITCSQSGSKEFTEQYPTFDVAIIDEVSKATPPELILAVLKAKKIVLVGDHKQLPPMIGMETYEEVAKQLDISEDKTTHMKTSLFEELFINASNTLKIMLSTQYRMHNQIMDSINQFYTDENELGLICGINNPDIMREHHCYGKAIERKNHIMWVDIPLIKEHFEEQSYTNYSFSNQAEVDCIKNILLTISANLYANNYNGQKKIGIISFYSNQVRLLEKELLDKEFADRICNLSLRIGSVDRFQGIECPVIICSFVRNNPKGEIGFAKDPRRVNVALSRAQELSIIVGCSELFCSTNKNSSATRIYQTIAKIILDVGGIRNALDFR